MAKGRRNKKIRKLRKEGKLTQNRRPRRRDRVLNSCTKSIESTQCLDASEQAYYDSCKLYREVKGEPVTKKAHFDDEKKQDIEMEVGCDVPIDKFVESDFIRDYCNIMNLDPSQVTILSIRAGSTAVNMKVHDVDIKVLSESLDDKQKLRNLSEKLKVILVETKPAEKHPKFRDKQVMRREAVFLHDLNKKYGPASMGGDTYWTGELRDGRNRGGKPYFCPVGWQRFTLQVRGMDYEEFAKNFDDWLIGYHGCSFDVGLSIMMTGLCGSYNANDGCTCHGEGLYMSPSIIYCAHARYATPKQVPQKHKKAFVACNPGVKDTDDIWVQFVLQLRINPKALEKGQIREETLGAGSEYTIDSNIKNEEMEWLIDTDGGYWDFADPKSDVVASGLMIRIVNKHPKYLPESEWWKAIPYIGANDGDKMDAKCIF